ncbi:MAG: tetratricopeptide repeat protein [bacterium]|nr:tetratricopeptide repeat protein [bacterium]
MNNDTPLKYFNLFNPAAVPKDVLLEEFVARQDMLEDMLEVITGNQAGEPVQHLLLIGPRGMGKTTTLYAVKYCVEDDPALEKEWLPLIFSEENYGIGDLADFWLEAIRCLEGTLDLMSDEAETLLQENPDDLASRAQETFFHLLSRYNKRALLLLDNINEIFESISDEQELHVLRALLMKDSRLMIIGGSASYFSHVRNLEQPFYDFFRVFTLERFNREEMEEVLRTLAERRNDKKVLQVIKKEPGRIQALRILTGGNPRLVRVVYRLLHEGAFGDVRQDLERLLDDCTPYFKHRIESLKTPARRVFDAIARNWDPTGAGQLTVNLRKKSNYISAQIKRLVDEGFIEEAGGSEKKKRYQVAERFYNIYYLMRYSRTGRQRLEWLATFINIFYSLEDYQKWADTIENEIHDLKEPQQIEEHLAFLSLMASAAEDSLLKKDLLDRTVRTTIDSAGYQALNRILDKQLQKDLGSHFSILEFLAGLPKKTQQKIQYQPGKSTWWSEIALLLKKENLYELAIEAYQKTVGLDPENYNYWARLGNEYFSVEHFSEAEQACRKSIELKSENLFPWLLLGLSLTCQKNFDEAENTFLRAAKLDSKSFAPWAGLGNLFYQQGRYNDAESTLLKSIRLKPDNEAAHSFLAAIYNEKNYPYATIMEEAVKGLRLNPGSDFPRIIFKQTCRQNDSAPWKTALPDVLVYLKNNPDNKDVYTFTLDGLLRLVSLGEEDAVVPLINDAELQDLFEPLLLAISAGNDNSVLETLAPERRALVKEIMEIIEQGKIKVLRLPKNVRM